MSDVEVNQILNELGLFKSAWFLGCLVLITLDVLYLAYRSRWGNGSAEPLWPFVTSRVTIGFLLVLAAIVDILTPNIPMLYLASLFYSGISIAHIVSGARQEGVLVPPVFSSSAQSLTDKGGADEKDDGPGQS